MEQSGAARPAADPGGTSFDSHHFAFPVSCDEFAAILGRVKSVGIGYGRDLREPDNGRLNGRCGGRGVYFTDPDGHLFELMTVAQ